MAKRKLTATLTRLPHSCGGTYVPHKMRGYDASRELGIPVVLRGTVPGLRCDKCGAIMVSGAVLDAASPFIVAALLERDRRLSGPEAAYLRKSRALTIDDLSDGLHVEPEDVRRWESSQSLTASQDFQLRAYIIGILLAARSSKRKNGSPLSPPRLVALAARALEHVRAEEAPAEPSPLPIAV